MGDLDGFLGWVTWMGFFGGWVGLVSSIGFLDGFLGWVTWMGFLGG